MRFDVVNKFKVGNYYEDTFYINKPILKLKAITQEDLLFIQVAGPEVYLKNDSGYIRFIANKQVGVAYVHFSLLKNKKVVEVLYGK